MQAAIIPMFAGSFGNNVTLRSQGSSDGCRRMRFEASLLGDDSSSANVKLILAENMLVTP
jgi:hypothetical protein